MTSSGVSDHIIIPSDIRSRYPYSVSGSSRGADPGECLEQLTVVAFLASVTSRIGLLTSVMVLPHRNPVHTAKALASIDVLSGGRLIAGCGRGVDAGGVRGSWGSRLSKGAVR